VPDITKEDIYAVFGLPPEEAVKYFERKGFRISWNWMDVWKKAHAEAFTVAKATRLDILEDLYSAIQDDLKNGGTFGQFQERVEPLLKAKGWWGKRDAANLRTGEIVQVQLGSAYRLETIYVTNTQVAYQAGRYQEFMKAVDVVPYWEYSAIGDRRTRPAHAAMSGRVFRWDDPVWQVWYPPCGFRCRCRIIVRTETERKRGVFQLSEGSGRMAHVEREIKHRDGTKSKVQTGAFRDQDGRLHAPDMGWDYHVGEAGAKVQKLYGDKVANAPTPLRKWLLMHEMSQ